MRYALRAELTKARTVPGPLTLGIALVVTFVAVTVATFVGTGPPRGQLPVDVVRLSLSGVALAQVLVVVMAVQLVGVEYRTGILQVSLLAVPRRWPVAAAKGLVIVGWTLAASVPAASFSLLAGRILLPRQGYTPDHGYALVDMADGSTLRAAGGAVLYLVLVGLISGGVALAVRDTVTTTVGLMALLYLFPVLIVLVNNAAWQRWLTRVGPMPAGSALWGTVPGTVTAGQGAATMAAWSVGATLIGLTALLWRSA
jgi:ABC-2 type transport system permease protein